MKKLSTRSNRVGLGRLPTLSLALVAALGFGACSSSDDDNVEPADASSNNGGGADAMPGAPDAMPTGPDAMQAALQIPDWTLEDIQPESPMFGQVYGLNEFNGKILIAVLVEGF